MRILFLSVGKTNLFLLPFDHQTPTLGNRTVTIPPMRLYRYTRAPTNLPHGGSGWSYVETRLPKSEYETAQVYRNFLRPKHL